MDSEATKLISHRMNAMQEDVGELRSAVREMTQALSRLILLEERQAENTRTNQRTAEILEKIETRIRVLELAQPQSVRAALWVDRVIFSAAGLLALYVLKAVRFF